MTTTPLVKENLKIIREKQADLENNLLEIMECCSKIDSDGKTIYISTMGKQSAKALQYVRMAMFNLNQAEKSL